MALLERGITHMKFFPAGAVRRDRRLEGLGGAAAGGPVLPDRRHRPRQRPGLSCAAQRAVRRRVLGGARRRDRRRRLGRLTALAQAAAALDPEGMRHDRGGPAILDHIRDNLDALRKSERKVAVTVMNDPWPRCSRRSPRWPKAPAYPNPPSTGSAATSAAPAFPI